MIVEWGEDERKLTDRVSVLVGGENGKYPSGNTLIVKGESECFVIDPSVDVVARGGAPVRVDAVLNSHAHEDHIPGNKLFADARVHIHEDDVPGVTTLEGLMDIYGLQGESREGFKQVVVEQFHFTPRPDARGFSDGAHFDLGSVGIEAVHLPGHTRGHSGFRIDDGVFFLSDIDLTGFGPYYGDAWSDLEDFEESLHRVRDEDARYYVTYHHKGVIEGRKDFLEMLDGYHEVIARRHEAMLEYLAEPRTISEMADHRFIYRPHVENHFANSVEQRSAELHVQRMLARGEAKEVASGRFQRG
ncbi:MAG: MBL fold metallo-hydrolase [Myxococcota bacterium]|jgi:glyoxylase-like metal-dependent hydrolase (beta-lactamase superfamily II)|nr:MBL fold metallo-hydrolase [Myxococcota bacterium]